MKKVLVTGSTGMLGADLVRTFLADKQYDVYGLSRSRSPLLPDTRQFIADLADPQSLSHIPLQPDVIVHAAAITDLNLCEREPELASRVHVDASGTLAASMMPHRFVYISTDSVFDGKKGNYTEADRPNPLNIYSMTKWKGEKAVQEVSQDRAVIVRTNIYGLHTPVGNSLAEWAIKEWAAGKKISGFTDTVFNALYTAQLAVTVKWLTENEATFPIINVGSSEAISKYDFLDKLRRAMGIEEALLKPAISADIKSTIERPKNTSLNTDLLAGFYKVPDFDSGIRALVNQIYSSDLRRFGKVEEKN